MLRTSTKNVAYEVISCLIDDRGHGVLTEIIKFLTTVNKHYVLEASQNSFLDGKNARFGLRMESEEETESYDINSSYWKGKNSSLSIGSANKHQNEDLMIKIRKHSIE